MRTLGTSVAASEEKDKDRPTTAGYPLEISFMVMIAMFKVSNQKRRHSEREATVEPRKCL